MKRKSRIVFGTAALTAAMALSACGSGKNTEQSGATGSTSEAVDQTEDTSEQSGDEATSYPTLDASTQASAEQASEDSGEGRTEIHVFQLEENFNPVVYGPPEDK